MLEPTLWNYIGPTLQCRVMIERGDQTWYSIQVRRATTSPWAHTFKTQDQAIALNKFQKTVTDNIGEIVRVDPAQPELSI